MMSHRDKQIEESPDSSFVEDEEGNMFSFWNDFLHEKFTEEGDGVLLALDKLKRTYYRFLVIFYMFTHYMLPLIFALNIAFPNILRPRRLMPYSGHIPKTDSI